MLTPTPVTVEDNGDGTLTIGYQSSTFSLGVAEFRDMTTEYDQRIIWQIIERIVADGIPPNDIPAIIGNIRSAPFNL